MFVWTGCVRFHGNEGSGNLASENDEIQTLFSLGRELRCSSQTTAVCLLQCMFGKNCFH